MTARPVAVLWHIKEPGGTGPVTHPISMDSTIMAHTRRTLMVSTGTHGRDTSTLPRELR